MKPLPPIGPEALEKTGAHVVGISGGKDSVALALLLVTEYPEVPFTLAITPTGNELPEMGDHWRNLSLRFKKPLYRVPGPTLIETFYKHNALPNFRMRFCTRDVKIEPFYSYMETLPQDSVLYVGLRADEEDRLGMQVTEDDNFRVTFPFQWANHRWGIDDVTKFLHINEIKIPDRTDCAWCFYQRLEEWHSLWADHRDIYNHGVLVEDLFGYTFRSPGRDTWPASLAELAEEFKKGRVPKPYKKKSTKMAQCAWCAK